MPVNVGGYEITKEMENTFSQIVKDGLVLHLDAGIADSYPGSGTTWFDLSPSEINATLTNGPTYTTLNGGAIDFDGTNDSVNFSYDLLRNFSLECWVNMDVISGFSYFGQGPTATNQGLHIWNSSASSLRFGMYTNDTDFSISLSTGTWYHFVFTYDHSSPFLKKMYLNGIEQSGTEVQTQSQYAGTGTLRVGATYGSGSYNFANGKFSITKIYNKILSATEINQNFNATRNRFGV